MTTELILRSTPTTENKTQSGAVQLVNPPLVRLVAALPMVVVDPKNDWSSFTEAPYARPEFSLGTAFANGFETFWHFTLARWACFPFSLIGGRYCYR
jgi:hypothetical protein